MIDHSYFSENKNFNSVKISIASASQIRSWSYGIVQRPDTVNYRTTKPEHGGLFCSRIFGPVKDYECSCGKYKRMKYKGTVCEKCGVEVTTSKVRRERMGHIELAAPVVHIWFLRSQPSKICTILDIPLKKIERVLYFDSYIITDPKTSTFKYGQVISEDEYIEGLSKFGPDSFDASMGAESIQMMLKNIDLKKEQQFLRTSLSKSTSEMHRSKTVKRLKLVEDFLGSGNKLEWMVMNAIPVIPPDLRPLVMLDGGRFATYDMNELYRRVINRNNRLHRLQELRSPDIIIKNEKRMLQEAVDSLFDNNRKSKVIKSSNKRPLKSLADMLKGKHGRFRQNLLGKRVDYSGRSVIVVGPELKLHQCGIPKKMALELMKPFIYSRLESDGISRTIKYAKQIVEEERPEVWDILEEVMKDHPVILNRAPTLHRLGIQAFEPILIEGKAIKLHPLVCTAFNADFDGDQMALHLPISLEAQLEARVLMMSTSNILSAANGEPVIVPTQDIVLGIYYLSLSFSNEEGEGSLIGSYAELQHALLHKKVTLHAKIKFRMQYLNELGESVVTLLNSTPGRLLILQILPGDLKINVKTLNKIFRKDDIASLLEDVYRQCGQDEAVAFSDKIMQLGFKYSCLSGISIGKDDMIVPESKLQHVLSAQNKVHSYEEQYTEGLITAGEKRNKSIDIWTKCTEDITSDMMEKLSGKCDNFAGLNSLHIMSDSGARGSSAQIRQLCGLRGLMTRPSGDIIETPIISNFKEGLNELEYFISTHGARKGLADTALKTSNSGYLTRKLVDVAQDCIVLEENCHTKQYITVTAKVDSSNGTLSLKEIGLGRISAEDVVIDGNTVVRDGDMIDENVVSILDDKNKKSIRVKSVLTCESKFGVCSVCYGRDLSTGQMVNLGEAVGVIAAQSIGEPGTQLTMRTFHVGGAAQKIATKSDIIAPCSGTVKFNNTHQGINMNKNLVINLMDGSESKLVSDIPYGAKIHCSDGTKVQSGDLIAEWDPYSTPILSEVGGTVEFVDLKESVNMDEIYDEITGINKITVTDNNKDKKSFSLKPKLVINNINGEIIITSNGRGAEYFLPVNAVLNVVNGQKIKQGDMLAKISKESSKNRDITGGLPRVVELFEARSPKEPAILSEIDGTVTFGKDYKHKRRVIVTDEDKTRQTEYFIPRGQHVNVNEGDYIKKGGTLLEGQPSLHDILRIMGTEYFAHYITEEIQQVYKLQGVKINYKHIETILRQMLKKVAITDPGETTFITGDRKSVV